MQDFLIREPTISLHQYYHRLLIDHDVGGDIIKKSNKINHRSMLAAKSTSGLDSVPEVAAIAHSLTPASLLVGGGVMCWRQAGREFILSEAYGD